jgi:microcystin-dependent protein
MAEPFLSEIRIFSFNFPPKGWALCNGQLLPINQNQALFALLGTTYGGDGRVTFALPNLQGRVPIHMGSGRTLGERAGEEVHTLTMGELPLHTHTLRAAGTAAATTGTPDSGAYLARQAGTYHAASSLQAMAPNEIGNVGGSQAHLNMQPFLTLSFCIALQGIFPSQN